jgi:hypothetical protein
VGFDPRWTEKKRASTRVLGKGMGLEGEAGCVL